MSKVTIVGVETIVARMNKAAEDLLSGNLSVAKAQALAATTREQLNVRKVQIKLLEMMGSAATPEMKTFATT